MTEDKKGKPDKRSINKKPQNPDEKLKKKICALLRKRYFEKKVINEKPFDPGGVLRKKPSPYNWGLKSQESQFKHETWKLKGKSLDKSWLKVTCSYVQSRAMRVGMSSVEVTQIYLKIQ